MKTSGIESLNRVTALAGLIAGMIDIGSAAAINWTNPLAILRFVASGVLGPAALHGGAPTVLLGLLLQLWMSVVIAKIYVIALRGLPVLRLHWSSTGVIYGALVFVVMNFVVMPLSRTFPDHHFPHFTSTKFVANLAAMIAFGLIIAFIARHVVGQRAMTAGR